MTSCTVPLPQVMQRAERVALMRATSDRSMEKVAKKTTRVSRRKGRRTSLHVPAKQRRHEEKREEYLLSVSALPQACANSPRVSTEEGGKGQRLALWEASCLGNAFGT